MFCTSATPYYLLEAWYCETCQNNSEAIQQACATGTASASVTRTVASQIAGFEKWFNTNKIVCPNKQEWETDHNKKAHSLNIIIVHFIFKYYYYL